MNFSIFYCPICGVPFIPGANSCTSCGTRLIPETSRPLNLGSEPPRTYPEPLGPQQPLPAIPLPQAKLRVLRGMVIALIIVSLVLGTTTAYLSQQNARLQSNLTRLQDQANTYYSSWQNTQNQNQGLHSQLDDLQAQNNYLSVQIQKLNLQAAGPTLSLWGCAAPCQTSSANAWSMSVGGWREGGVPDTFTYLPQYTSTVAVGVYFLTLQQYVQFYDCPYTTDATTRITCISGAYNYYSPTTSLNGVFHLAEGCASYLAIYYSTQSGTLYPNVQVTYTPASSLTGVCV